MNLDLSIKANEILDKVNKDEQKVFVDPATIILVISILSMIFQGIRMWLQYRKNKLDGQEIQVLCSKPSRLANLFVRRGIINKFGRKTYKDLGGEEFVSAIFETGANTSPEELDNLLQKYAY
jgi:hypothetical protein